MRHKTILAVIVAFVAVISGIMVAAPSEYKTLTETDTFTLGA